MSRLDAENSITAFQSIEHISGLNREKICELFDEIQYQPNVTLSGASFLHELEKRCIRFNHTETCWFHFTRNFPDQHYDAGILPLPEVLDDLWFRLYDLAKSWISSAEWMNLRKEIEDENNNSKGSVLYRGKLENNSCVQYGPYALLIYDIDCFDEPISELDYLKDGSEMIYHMCDYFHVRYGQDLFERYRQNTKPCVVKFVQPTNNRDDIGEVLAALYYQGKNQMSLYSVSLFPGRGIKVPQFNIEKVVYLE